MIKFTPMIFSRFVPFLLLLPLMACGPRGTPASTTESVEVLHLKIRAKEEEFRRFKQKLETSAAHSRFKEAADLEELEERLTSLRLKRDEILASDSAAQAKVREEFDATFSDLSRRLREMEIRYGTASQ